jgi:hypothetical protein
VTEKHQFDGQGQNLSNYEYEQRQMKYGLTPARSESQMKSQQRIKGASSMDLKAERQETIQKQKTQRNYS